VVARFGSSRSTRIWTLFIRNTRRLESAGPGVRSTALTDISACTNKAQHSQPYLRSFVNSLPFRWKLTLLILLVCTISLGVSFVGFYIYDGIRFHDKLERRVDSAKRLVIDRAVAAIESAHGQTVARPQSPRCGGRNRCGGYLQRGEQIAGQVISRLEQSSSSPAPAFQHTLQYRPHGDPRANPRHQPKSSGTLFIKADPDAVQDSPVRNLLRGAGGILLISTLFALVSRLFPPRPHFWAYHPSRHRFPICCGEAGFFGKSSPNIKR